MAPQLQLKVGSRDLTGHFQGLTASNSDPGGFETLQCRMADLEGIVAGAKVSLFYGLDLVWSGLVNEPGDDRDQGRAQFSLSALGDGVVLKDNTMREIFAERDLSKWKGPSLHRRASIAPAGFMEGSMGVIRDSQGSPALELVIGFDQWGNTVIPIAHAGYDAAGVEIAEIRGTFTVADGVSFADPSWKLALGLSATDAADGAVVPTVESGDIQPLGNSASTTFGSTGKSYAYMYLHYVLGPAGTQGTRYSVRWTSLFLRGSHGLTLRGSTPDDIGYWCSDIVRNVALRPEVGRRLNVDNIKDSSEYILLQSVYLTPVTPEAIIADQAKIMGWHWGVWEPIGLTDTRPSLWFCPVPKYATVTVDAQRCSKLKVPKVRRDALYTSARVHYTNAAGNEFYEVVEIDNPYLALIGEDRQLDLDLGIGSQPAAAAFGRFALELSLAAARGSGSCTLPEFIEDGAGGMRPSCTLKAGRDRLRLRNLPDSAISQLGGDSRRYDTFHVRRVELQQDDKTGQVTTNVEFDGGGDLMETITARLQIAQTVAGIG